MVVNLAQWIKIQTLPLATTSCGGVFDQTQQDDVRGVPAVDAHLRSSGERNVLLHKARSITTQLHDFTQASLDAEDLLSSNHRRTYQKSKAAPRDTTRAKSARDQLSHTLLLFPRG